MLERTTITDVLRDTAAHHGVELLFAIESGSRAWGLASTDSDYDVRFVYCHPREWYLRLHPGRDMVGPLMQYDGELDLVGWDVRKFLHHLVSSNPNVLEWLASPQVYYAKEGLLHQLRELADGCFRPRKAMAHYLGIAHGARQAGLGEDGLWNVKKFFYWLRPLLAATYVQRYRRRPPITLKALLLLVEEADVIGAIDALTALKATVPEDYRCSIAPRLLDYGSELKQQATEVCNALDKEVPTGRDTDTFFRHLIGWE